MGSDYRVLGARAIEEVHDRTRDFAYDLLVGLSERPKRIPSRYFYDDAGSRLFQRITALPEYYLSACEAEILTVHAKDILEPLLVSGPFDLVDLGAGDGKKTMILLGHLARLHAEFTYVPIDISEGAMRQLVELVRQRLPPVRVEGIVGEYRDAVLQVGREHGARRKLVLFLGSNIGNFDAVQARAFLRRLWSVLREGDLALVGFDLKKDIDVLLAAYNDSEGVTAAFNMNLLNRANRDLGASFDLRKFCHHATYDVFSGAMKSYLVSREPQIVGVAALERSFAFDAWEPIHTEYSYKYLRSDVEALARDTGFALEARFEDARGFFADALWRVVKAAPAREPRA